MENVFRIVTSWFRSLVVETSWFWSAGEPSKCFCQVHTFSLEKCVCFWVQKNQPCEAVLCEALSGVNVENQLLRTNHGGKRDFNSFCMQLNRVV